MTGANSLTKAIIEYLNSTGWYVWRNNNGAIFSPKQGVFRKNPSALKGIPDIIGFHKHSGRFIGIEVKIGRDRLSEDQSSFLERLNQSNGIGFTAHTFDQFLATMTTRAA